jgi:hypothetical protein
MTMSPFHTLGAATLAAFLCGPVVAQDQSAAEILSEAQGVLHLTCNTMVETYGDDEDAMLDAIGLMIAVSLNNRGIDFVALELTPQENQEIQAEFADQIGDACADDADALMAGIVDHTVADLVTFY